MYKINSSMIIRLILAVLLIHMTKGITIAQEWADLYINQLPDTSFAVIETDDFGKEHRHCPYRDVNGEIDVEQLIYCLGTLDRETWIDSDSEWLAKKRLKLHYQRWRNALKTRAIPSVEINSASLEELVQLPHIGPVLAVNIVEYRETHSAFETFEDLEHVKGVGQGTLKAIRFYIAIE